MILASKRRVEHPFTGQNTQQTLTNRKVHSVVVDQYKVHFSTEQCHQTEFFYWSTLTVTGRH